jgi:hypothetical protein
MAVSEADIGCHIDQPLRDNRPVRNPMRLCWLRWMINHIPKSCGKGVIDTPPLSMKIILLVLHRCIWAM